MEYLEAAFDGSLEAVCEALTAGVRVDVALHVSTVVCAGDVNFHTLKHFAREIVMMSQLRFGSLL